MLRYWLTVITLGWRFFTLSGSGHRSDRRLQGFTTANQVSIYSVLELHTSWHFPNKPDQGVCDLIDTGFLGLNLHFYNLIWREFIFDRSLRQLQGENIPEKKRKIRGKGIRSLAHIIISVHQSPLNRTRFPQISSFLMSLPKQTSKRLGLLRSSLKLLHPPILKALLYSPLEPPTPNLHGRYRSRPCGWCPA